MARSYRSFLHWPLTIASLLGGGVLIGATLFGHPSGRDDVARNLVRIQEVLSYVRHDYVDSVNTDELGQNAIDGMLERLDPHSSYIPAEELKMANAQLEEDFDGIGVEFVLLHDTIQVITPIVGGPSDKAGVLAGDRIVKVDGETIAGVHIGNMAVFNKLRGPRGSKVELQMARPGMAKLVTISLKRDRIPTRSVDASVMTDSRTGYIKISRFSGGTDKEFHTELVKLKKQGMQQLVLDLRDNPGGYLDKAIAIADEFLDNGRTITYTEGKSAKYNHTYKATKPGLFETGALTVLINEGSASAAEILAGALQDNDRATVVGRRSFGKGLVQMPISLSDGSELRLTISRYHTPSGRCIQKPYDTHDLAQYEEDLDERFVRGELFHEDSIHIGDTARYRTSSGRIVYGGGGIKPDLFVGLDTIKNNMILAQMENRFVFAGVANEYARRNARQLKNQNLAAFRKNFTITTELENLLISRARHEGIKFNDGRWAKLRTTGLNELKATLARTLYGDRGYYSVRLEDDQDFSKAFQALESGGIAKS